MSSRIAVHTECAGTRMTDLRIDPVRLRDERVFRDSMTMRGNFRPHDGIRGYFLVNAEPGNTENPGRAAGAFGVVQMSA
nr:hypothetical protein StreXyl84_16230 [Streptomyces sp. Xyl84]